MIHCEWHHSSRPQNKNKMHLAEISVMSYLLSIVNICFYFDFQNNRFWLKEYFVFIHLLEDF